MLAPRRALRTPVGRCACKAGAMGQPRTPCLFGRRCANRVVVLDSFDGNRCLQSVEIIHVAFDRKAATTAAPPTASYGPNEAGCGLCRWECAVRGKTGGWPMGNNFHFGSTLRPDGQGDNRATVCLSVVREGYVRILLLRVAAEISTRRRLPYHTAISVIPTAHPSPLPNIPHVPQPSSLPTPPRQWVSLALSTTPPDPPPPHPVANV